MSFSEQYVFSMEEIPLKRSLEAPLTKTSETTLETPSENGLQYH